MKRLLFAVMMMVVALPLWAENKTILTTEQVAKIASIVHSGFRKNTTEGIALGLFDSGMPLM